jgi:hypothetical protein
VNNGGFVVRSVEPRYERSRALTGSREPREPIRTGAASIELTCKACREQWRSRPSRSGEKGSFVVTVMSFVVTCNRCGQQSEISKETVFAHGRL